MRRRFWWGDLRQDPSKLVVGDAHHHWNLEHLLLLEQRFRYVRQELPIHHSSQKNPYLCHWNIKDLFVLNNSKTIWPSCGQRWNWRFKTWHWGCTKGAKFVTTNMTKTTNPFCHGNELLSGLSLHTPDEFLSVVVLTSSEIGNNLDLSRYHTVVTNSSKTQHNANDNCQHEFINQDFILENINHECVAMWMRRVLWPN